MKKIDIDNLKRDNIYATPKNFFEDFEGKIMQKTTELEQQKVHHILYSIPKKWYTMAASVVLLISLGIFLLPKKHKMEIILAKNTKTTNSNTTSTNASQHPQNNIITDNEVPLERKKVVNAPPIKKKTSVKKAEQKTNNTDENIDTFLASYSDKEINTLANDTENDTYLDIYF